MTVIQDILLALIDLCNLEMPWPQSLDGVCPVGKVLSITQIQLNSGCLQQRQKVRPTDKSIRSVVELSEGSHLLQADFLNALGTIQCGV